MAIGASAIGARAIAGPGQSGLAAVDVSGALTLPKPAVAGVPTVAVDIAGVPPVFVSLTDGANNRSVTVPSGSDRLLVVAIYGNGMSACSGTYAGIALEVATTGNGSIQILYLVEPPEGAATLAISGATPDHVIAAHYTSAKRAFAAGQAAGSVNSLALPLASFLLMAGCESDGLADVFPGTETIERFDDGNDGYGDKIPPSAAIIIRNVSIGWQTSVSANFALAAFHPAGPTLPKPTVAGTVLVSFDVSGALTLPKPTVTGVPTVDVAASGTLTLPKPAVAGVPTVDLAASGTLTLPKPAVAGVPAVVVAASGALSMPPPAVAGNVTTAIEVFVDGALTLPKPTVTGVPTVDLAASGTLTLPKPAVAGVPTVDIAASGALTLPKPAAAASFSILVSVSGALSMPPPVVFGIAFNPEAPIVEPGVFVTVVVPHGAASLVSPAGAVTAVRAHGSQQSKSPSGGVTVRKPSGRVD